jgi:uncharacterized repeat protein (TIGR03803 family)
MKRRTVFPTVIRYTHTAAAVALLILTAVASPSAHAQTFTVLHTFTGSPDGVYPSPLIRDADGNLYGTAQAGGSDNNNCAFGCGMVYKINPAGKQIMLYDFPGGNNGGYPVAGLVRDASGNLYGTTQGLGTVNLSVVFELTPDGKETPYVPPGRHQFRLLRFPCRLGRDRKPLRHGPLRRHTQLWLGLSRVGLWNTV